MNLFQPRSIVPCLLAGALALAACSSDPSRPKTEVAPPSAGLEQPAPDTAATGGNTGGTYPYGTAQGGGQGGTAEAKAGGEDEIAVVGPEGRVYVRSDPSDADTQSDVESCYAYAQAQVAHDARIESDVNAAFESEAGGLGLTDLRQRMNNFERGNRVPALFNSCMVAKGYSRQ